MSAAALIAWLLALAGVPDGTPLHAPIRRPPASARVLATVALEHPEVDPKLLAATLDVIAARESAYNFHSRGDCRPFKRPGEQCTVAEHPRSCGAWSTPCALTPMPHEDVVSEAIMLAQARLAATMIFRSWMQCPEHPLSIYASGHCQSVRIAREYERLIRDEALR